MVRNLFKMGDAMIRHYSILYDEQIEARMLQPIATLRVWVKKIHPASEQMHERLQRETSIKTKLHQEVLSPTPKPIEAQAAQSALQNMAGLTPPE